MSAPAFKGHPCSFDGCKVQKLTKPRVLGGEPFCAVHFKHTSSKINKAAAVKCKHVCLIGEVNAGQQCGSKAVTEDGFCNRHSKKSTRRVASLPTCVQLPANHCRPEEIKFWANTRVALLDGTKFCFQKDTGFCVEKTPDGKIIVIGAILKREASKAAEFVPAGELSAEVVDWCEQSGLEIL